MFTTFLASLQAFALAHGAWGVFVLAFVQEIFPPIPSTLVTVASGGIFLASQPVTAGSIGMLFVMVGIPVAFGMTLGALIVYGLVYWGGMPIIERYGSYVGVSTVDIERLRTKLKGTSVDEVLLFVARAFPLTPSILLNVLCGLVRWNPIAFVLSTFFGTVIRATWSGFIGWQLGSALVAYERYIRLGNWAVVAIVVVIGVGFIIYRKRTRPANIVDRE